MQKHGIRIQNTTAAVSIGVYIHTECHYVKACIHTALLTLNTEPTTLMSFDE